MAIIAILGISIGLVCWLAWRFYRQVPPSRAFVAIREHDVSLWEANVRSDLMPLAQAVLEAVCDAFLFRRADAWRLRPDDKLRHLYETSYPPKLGLPDTMEYENLFDTLRRNFKLTKHQLHVLWASEPTLGDLVAVCIQNSEDSGQST